MAVYTLINKHQLESLLAYYNLGELIEYTPVAAGTTNSNYKIVLSNNNVNSSYILTILEQNLSKSELDFCVKYAQHLLNSGVKAAAPLVHRNGASTVQFLDKIAILTPFINGNPIISNSTSLSAHHCTEIATEVAKMHTASRQFKLARKNPAGLTWCINVFKQIDNLLSPDHYLLIKDEIEYLIITNDIIIEQSEEYIQNITGAIHADLFCDNTIFKHNNLVGVIDFYYACTDYYLYDLAILVNDWTLDYHKKEILCLERYNSFIDGYLLELNKHPELYTHLVQAIDEIEDFWQIMLRRAALRFWLLRLLAFHIPNGSAVKTIKDPRELELKLLFHRENKLELVV